MKKIIEQAHALIKEVLTKEDVLIDMTLGNGLDTAFFAPYCRKIYAFDVQEQAITQAKLINCDHHHIEYILDGHEHVRNYVREEVKAVIYNLGYLPKGDKSKTTEAPTTITSLQQAQSLLAVGGRIAIVIYPGHFTGMQEKEAIYKSVQSLDQKKWEVWFSSFPNQKNNPPLLIVLEKL